MTPSEQIRNEVYHSLKLTKSEEKVLKAIEVLGTADNQTISEITGLPLSSVTGRINELKNRFLVEYDSRLEETETGKPHSLWRLVDPKERPIMIKCELGALMNNRDDLIDDLDKMTIELSITGHTRALLTREIAKLTDRVDELNKL